MDYTNLNELFTIQSLLSMQGAAAASLIVPNVLIYLLGDSFKPYKKWVAFLIAMALSYVVAILAPTQDWTKWLIAFFNGFLVFASAVGINQAAGSRAATMLGKRSFFESWY